MREELDKTGDTLSAGGEEIRDKGEEPREVRELVFPVVNMLSLTEIWRWLESS